MCVASTIRTTETFHLRDPATLFYKMTQIALGYEIRIGFPGLGTIAFHGQIIYMPFQAFLVCQMAPETLIDTCHGTTHITVCASFEKMVAFGPHIYVYILLESYEKNIGPFPYGHWVAFKESS